MQAQTTDGFKFLCPNGTIFSQENFVCDWYPKVNCDESEYYYHLNNEFENILKTQREMLTAVQQKFSYTLRKLINTHLELLKSQQEETTEGVYDNESEYENLSSSTESPITTTFDYDADKYYYTTEQQNDQTTELLSNDDDDSSTSTTIATTSFENEDVDTDDEVNEDNNDESISSTTTESTIESFSSETTNSRLAEKINSFSDLWGADVDELDEILNNRLKKSYDFVTPSQVTRRDVSFLDGQQYVQAGRNTYLPPINLRPPVQPTTQAINYYQV